MFSIKVIQNRGKDSEEELLYQAEYVEFRKKLSADGTVGPGVRLLAMSGEGHNSVHFGGPDTDVYVMNEAGATVSRYVL